MPCAEYSCFPDSNAQGLRRKASASLLVRSRPASCGAIRAAPKDTVYLDMWDDYLSQPEASDAETFGIIATPSLPRADERLVRFLQNPASSIVCNAVRLVSHRAILRVRIGPGGLADELKVLRSSVASQMTVTLLRTLACGAGAPRHGKAC